MIVNECDVVEYMKSEVIRRDTIRGDEMKSVLLCDVVYCGLMCSCVTRYAILHNEEQTVQDNNTEAGQTSSNS